MLGRNEGSTRTSSLTTNSIGSRMRPAAAPASQSASSGPPPAQPTARTANGSPTTSSWTPPRMPTHKSNRRASIHSRPTSTSATISFAITANSGRARSTDAIPRRSTTHGRNGPSARTSRRWSSTTSSRRWARVGIESTRSSIRQLRRRCSESRRLQEIRVSLLPRIFVALNHEDSHER